MRQIGADEAKTHLAELLNKVARGESFLLTRHGQVVAMLTQLLDVNVRPHTRSSINGTNSGGGSVWTVFP